MPSDALDSSRTVLRIVLPNGVVIHVAGDLDGERLGDLVIAAGQIPSESLTALLPDNWVKNNSQHVLVHRVEESRRAANCKRDRRERRRRLATPSAGTKARPASPAPPKTGPSKSDAAKPDATSRWP